MGGTEVPLLSAALTEWSAQDDQQGREIFSESAQVPFLEKGDTEALPLLQNGALARKSSPGQRKSPMCPELGPLDARPSRSYGTRYLMGLRKPVVAGESSYFRLAGGT